MQFPPLDTYAEGLFELTRARRLVRAQRARDHDRCIIRVTKMPRETGEDEDAARRSLRPITRSVKPILGDLSRGGRTEGDDRAFSGFSARRSKRLQTTRAAGSTNHGTTLKYGSRRKIVAGRMSGYLVSRSHAMTIGISSPKGNQVMNTSPAKTVRI